MKPVHVIVIAAALAIPALARKPGEPIKPGFNLFSKQPDIELGQQAAAEVRKRAQPTAKPQLQDYIHRWGERPPSTPTVRDSGRQCSSTLVNDDSITASATPG